MNKKATVQEIFLIIVILFIISIGFLVIKTVWNEAKPDLQGKFGDKADAILDQGDSLFSTFDYLFIFMVIGLAAAAAIMAFTVDFHPVFWIFTIIIAAVGTIVAAIFSNAYGDMAATSDFTNASTTFAGTSFIMNNLVLFIVAIAFIIIIAMFAKFKQGGGE